MQTEGKTNLSHTLTTLSEYIPDWANAFYRAKKVEGISSHTPVIYKQQFGHFLVFCQGQVIEQVSQITPTTIREYLLWLEEGRHNPGRQHAAYRALRTFLLGYENEVEPDDWHNPIKKVKAPRLAEGPLKPIDLLDVQAMVKACKTGNFLDTRDKAIILASLDTGARAREFLAVNLDDLGLNDGAMTIRQGKGRKPRTVFLGKIAWRAKSAGVEIPSPHDFRRAFCLAQLQACVPETTIARIMGYASTQLILRYARQTGKGIQEFYRSPVDGME